MSITGLRKYILELKSAANFEYRHSEDYRIKNMADEELQEEINRELDELGYESEESYLEAAKKFLLEKDSQANVTHDYAIHKRIFELFEDVKIWEEFMLKYSSLELTE